MTSLIYPNVYLHNIHGNLINGILSKLLWCTNDLINKSSIELRAQNSEIYST